MKRNAYFAGGCFWCITPFFKIYGAEAVVSGFSGGDEKTPSYEEVKAQKTGHRETIEVSYDDEIVSYGDLLEIFLENIDPYDAEGQFIDRGHSYSPAVYYVSEEEKKAAEAAIQKLKEESGRDPGVAVEAFKFFVRAEEYHQDYYLKNPEAFQEEMIKSGRESHGVRQPENI